MVIPQQQTAAAMFAGQKPLLQRQPVVIGQLGGLFQGLINVCTLDINSSLLIILLKCWAVRKVFIYI